MNARILFALLILIQQLSFNACAWNVSFEGEVLDTQEGSAVLGTFKPGFNPYQYKYVYGIDQWGNMDGPRLSQAIADGNFVPVANGFLTGGLFGGSGIGVGAQGEQLWIFLFDDLNPDSADQFALFSGSDASWFAPASSGSTAIFADTADQFVFGSQGIRLQGMPIPEPSSLSIATVAVAGLFSALRRPVR